MNAEFAYQAYENGLMSLLPARLAASFVRASSECAAALFGPSPFTRTADASAELFERLTRRYGKRGFGLEGTEVAGARVAVREHAVLSMPFCSLVRFERELPAGSASGPKILVVAPMSGHHASLLRGTIDRLLPANDVYVTDWTDARDVPASSGRFGFDDYVDYLVAMLEHLGPDTHVMAVCQPTVPVIAAVSLMSEDRNPCVPRSMILLGGPVDTRESPTEVNRLATEKGFRWFADNVISVVPFPHAGAGRRVYPGFLQLGGFISMNLDRHVKSHGELFVDLSTGNEAGAAKHREFYDEYLSVMDMTEEFYLETILKVFVEHHLPEGRLLHRGRPVRPETIVKTAMMTVEGGRDDITGRGQTAAAHRLCSGIPDARRLHHVEAEAGHYGIFSGSRYRGSVAPAIESFIAAS